ncbi:MAG: hypothetical protein DHS20C17_20760 [Cyclobacteriaceae bacterium]|nr:MAG: hypothetical protein DHS20C17_20760 [Cyclobacteriaceae bacterium]
MEEPEQKQPFLKRMQEKWGLTSIFQVVLILIVFALTGMTVVWVRPVIFDLLGIQNANGWIKTVSYLVLVFPLYQGLLLFYGFVFGQFNFFWEKEKKLAKAVMRLFDRS